MWPVAQVGAGGTVGGAAIFALLRALTSPVPGVAPLAEPFIPGDLPDLPPPSWTLLILVFGAGYCCGVLTGPLVDLCYLTRRTWGRLVRYLDDCIGEPLGDEGVGGRRPARPRFLQALARNAGGAQ